GADGVVDLRGRVEADAKDLLHEAGGGLLEGGDAVVGVAPVVELVHLALENVADDGVGHVVVLADAEVEEAALGVGGQGGALGALDLPELVDLRALAVVSAAEAVGEQGLKPGVSRCGGHQGSNLEEEGQRWGSTSPVTG